MIPKARSAHHRGSEGVIPTFLIIGAMRSGTTSVARQLGQHPEVFIAPQKEVHFFDLNWERGMGWYERQFQSANGEPAVGEASPSYLHDARAIERIAKTLPEARLIALLRDPVSRAYSHYWHNRARGREDLSFEEAIAAEPDRISGLGWDTGRKFAYLGRGRYATQLQRVDDHFDRSALRVLLFEEYRADPASVLADLFRFAGVDPSFTPPDPAAALNGFVTFRSVHVRNATRRLPPLLRDGIGRLNVTRGSYPPMDPETRAMLKERFAEDNARLAARLGRSLEVWER
jgi:hypothetical protein